MRIDFDKDSDAIYFRLSDSEIVESEEIAPGIVYDFDGNDSVVGIEVLNLSHKRAEDVKQISFPFTPEDKELLKEIFNLFACA
jgi:uncharacterized protein YuzE